MSDLKSQLTSDMKSTMKSKQKERLLIIRMVLAAIPAKAGAPSPIKDMGKVVDNIRPSLHGRTDMDDVGAIVINTLSQ